MYGVSGWSEYAVVLLLILVSLLFYKRKTFQLKPKPSRASTLHTKIPFEDSDVVPHDKYFFSLYRKHGDVFKVRFMGDDFIVLTGDKGLEFFKNNEKLFQVAGSTPSSWIPLYGDDNPILTASEESHKLFRKTVTPTFMSSKATDSFLPILADMLEETMTKWRKQGKFHTSELAFLSFSICWRWIFGVSLSNQYSLEYIFHQFELFSSAIVSPYDEDPESPYAQGLDARKKICAVLQHIIHSKQQASNRRIATSRTYSTEQSLFEAFEHSISISTNEAATLNKKLEDLLIGVVFAAFHAPTMALNGALYQLCLTNSTNEQIVENDLNANLTYSLLQEINMYRNKQNDSSSTSTKTENKTLIPHTLSSLNTLKLLNQFTKEVLRMYNAGTGIYRCSASDFDYESYRIPKDHKIFIFTGFDHYNVPAPDDFMPFDSQTTANDVNDKKTPEQHRSYKWLPFGIGTRHCLGQMFALAQIKMFVIVFLTNFKMNFRFATNAKPNPRLFPHFEINGDVEIF